MRRKLRSVAAGIAGVALLAGAGSTLALWTDETRLARDRATLGALALTASDLSWDDVSPDAVGSASPARPIAAVEDFLLVPGDEVLGTGEVELTLDGDTLRAVLTLDGGTGLPPWLDWDIWFTTADGTEITGDLHVAASGTVQVHVRVGFPRGAAPHLDHQRESFRLEDLSLTLRQVLTAGPH